MGASQSQPKEIVDATVIQINETETPEPQEDIVSEPDSPLDLWVWPII